MLREQSRPSDAAPATRTPVPWRFPHADERSAHSANHYGNPEHWPVAAGIVADAMNGDASLLKLIGSGPGLCAHILVPSGDDVDKPSLVVVVDRTHQTPGILVFQDRDKGAKEFSEIVEFALNMRGTGRLPKLVEGGLQRWTEGSGC